MNHATPPPVEGPQRITLVHLAARGATSPALTRVVAAAGVQHGSGRVAVAAFNSSV